VRPEQAAHLLVERAAWNGRSASLDLEVLFGPLLRDRKVRCIGFQFGTRVFWLPRALLARARRTLRRLGPTRAWLDDCGLHLRWREGAGGLNLHGLPAPPSRARVLRVVFESPTARVPHHILDQRSAAIPLSSVSDPPRQATAHAAPRTKAFQMNVTETPRLAPPLRVLPDMTASWRDADLDFDAAADRLVEAHRVNGAARDQPVVDLRTWRLRERGGLFSLQPLSDHQPARALRTTAFSALATRLGAPAEFLRDQLPAPLQIATLNYLLANVDRPVPATLRLRDDEVTTIVSQRYAALDPVEFVDTLREALVAHGLLREVRVRVVATGVTDLLRLVLPSEQAAVKVGDVTALGIDVSTSCFGRSAVHVKPMLWRLVCTNGMRSTERLGSFSFRHIGDTQRLRDGLSDAIPTAIIHGRGLMTQWRTAVDVFIEDVAAEIEALTDLTVAERKRVEAAIAQEAQVPQLPERIDVYGFVNGLTQAAHEAETSRRLELEGLAGALLRRHVS
jgi:uncharacterized protein DUF932